MKMSGRFNKKYTPNDIRAWMLSNNLNTKDLAKFLNITPITINTWIRGAREPSFTNLQKLAIKYNLDPDMFIFLDKTNSNNTKCIL